MTVKDIPSRGATVDTRFQSRDTLLQYIEGKPWKVDYFQIAVGPDDEASQQQVGVSPALQQYKCLHGYQLMVTQAINSGTTQDETSKSMIVEGTSNMFPGVIPNHGDLFIGDIGDGREGLFRVIHSERKTFMRESCFEIRYALVGYADTESATIEDLKRKTIQDLWWHQPYFGQGNAALTTDQYNTVIDLDRVFQETVEFYMLEFFSNEKQTLIVPGQDFRTYDPFMTRYVRNLITHQDSRAIGRMRIPTVDEYLVTRYPTVLDALLERNIRMLLVATHRVRVVDTVFFRSQPLLAGIYYEGIERLVFPFRMPRNDHDYTQGCPNMLSDALMQAGKPRFADLERLLSNANLDGLYWQGVNDTDPVVENLQDIVPVTADDYYIFSRKFYVEKKPTSKLEHLVLQHLNQAPIDRELLVRLARDSHTWGTVERYYYLPTLWALMVAALRSL